MHKNSQNLIFHGKEVFPWKKKKKNAVFIKKKKERVIAQILIYIWEEVFIQCSEFFIFLHHGCQ